MRHFRQLLFQLAESLGEVPRTSWFTPDGRLKPRALRQMYTEAAEDEQDAWQGPFAAKLKKEALAHAARGDAHMREFEHHPAHEAYTAAHKKATLSLQHSNTKHTPDHEKRDTHKLVRNIESARRDAAHRRDTGSR